LKKVAPIPRAILFRGGVAREHADHPGFETLRYSRQLPNVGELHLDIRDLRRPLASGEITAQCPHSTTKPRGKFATVLITAPDLKTGRKLAWLEDSVA
jgi:hypothetical protein